MKYFVIFLFFLGSAGLSFAEPGDCNNTICILDASWDGTEFVNPGSTYWLRVQIPVDEDLHVKIYYYDQSVVQDKTYSPDESGKVLIEYTSPNKEDSLSYYRVDMYLDGLPDVRSGAIFRIGDTYNPGFFPIQISPGREAKPGDTIHLSADSNNRWSMPMAPNHSFNATLYDPSGNIAYHKTLTTDKYGSFEDSFQIFEPGFYRLDFKDRNSQASRFFPTNFDVLKAISAEGKNFDIRFGFEGDGIMFSVDDMIFDKEGKSLKVLTTNPTFENVRFEITIPHEFLDGNMTTFLDGGLRKDVRHRDVLGYSHTVFSLPPGKHIVEMVGTTAIPEFLNTAFLVLIPSIFVAIFFSRLKNSRFAPQGR